MRGYEYILDAAGEPVRAIQDPIVFQRRSGMSQSHARHCDKECTRRHLAQLFAWAQWFETAERHVAKDVVTLKHGGIFKVSTVFLGLDHAWFATAPVLWETMIFGGPLDQFCERYRSVREARAGHRRALQAALDAAVAAGDEAIHVRSKLVESP